MSKLRIIYIVSILILGVLIVLTVFRPMAGEGQYSTVQQEALLSAENEWIIEFDIMNHEGSDQKYTITVVVDDKPYSEDVWIGDGKAFTYIHHIHRDRVTEGIVTFTTCKEGEETPFEQAVYYLK